MPGTFLRYYKISLPSNVSKIHVFKITYGTVQKWSWNTVLDNPKVDPLEVGQQV